MERSGRELLETLEKLGEGELQRFKDKLSEIQPKEGYQHLSSGSLRNADPPALTDLLLLFYGTDYGAEVAAEALRAIDQGALAKRIDRLIDDMRHGFIFNDSSEKNFFKWHQKRLKDRLYMRKGFMYDQQYQTIRAEKTSQEKMQKLYKLVPSWNKWQKDQLYQALKETNRDLVEELEGGHFVDRHREQLIQQVPEVDRVLKLLRGHTLTPEQYQSISTGRSNVEQMQKLYELVPSWGREHKDQLQQVLWITNRALVAELEGKHFVDWHREQLIQRTSSVDAVLDVLHRVKTQHEMQKQGHESHMEAPHDQISIKELVSASGFTGEETDSNSSSAAGIKAAGRIICQQTLLTSTGSVAGAAGETGRNQSPTACLRGQHKCNWCAREEEDLPEEIKPEIIQDLDRNQEMY
ncbi:unnamed protein product, partial [Natator depressus]